MPITLTSTMSLPDTVRSFVFSPESSPSAPAISRPSFCSRRFSPHSFLSALHVIATSFRLSLPRMSQHTRATFLHFEAATGIATAKESFTSALATGFGTVSVSGAWSLYLGSSSVIIRHGASRTTPCSSSGLLADGSTKMSHRTPNKTDAGNGSYGICRVIDASRSPSPDPSRSANFHAHE
jgi:hypothetical protein